MTQHDPATEYVLRAIAGFIGDPADSDFQSGFLAALVVVAEEGMHIPHPMAAAADFIAKSAKPDLQLIEGGQS